MKVFGITGASGSGKTVLVEQLIPRLAARGLRVSVIKHTHHDFDLDRPGKDSWRHREAGAREVMVVGPRMWALFHELRGAPEPDLDQLLDRLSPCDVVLVEGFKSAPIPKLEVVRPAHGQPALYPASRHVIAVASDAPDRLPAAGRTLAYLDLNDPEAIVDYLLTALAGQDSRPVPTVPTAAAARVYGIAGWSGAGKTTLICRLIPELARHGVSVAVLKHAHKGFDIDRPGKDSHRLRVAGAREVLLAGPRRWGLLHELPLGEEPPLADCRKCLAAVDLLLVEGFKQDALVKLEVFRAAHGRPPMYTNLPQIRAVATDAPLVAPLPVLDLNDPAAVAGFLLQQLRVQGLHVPADAPADAVRGRAITGVILAGGLGRRMGGVDKALQTLDGQPMVQHVLERLRPQVSEVLINANQNQEFYGGLGCPVVTDRIAGFAGPLAGLHAALSTETAPLVLTVPCDSPFLPDDLASRLLAALDEAGADIAVAKTFDRLHPVFCLCRREVLPSLTTYLESGERKVERWLASCRTVQVAFDDEAEAFRNINTGEDLRRFSQSASGQA